MNTLKSLFLIIMLSLIIAEISAQNHIQKFEYWFNDDYNQKVVTSILPEEQFELTAQLSANSLPDGIHRLNIRFLDDSSRYSSVVSSFFMKFGGNSVSQGNSIHHYEYWFDNDYSTAVQVPVANLALLNLDSEVSSVQLSQGLHTISIRFRDASGIWSSVATAFFLKFNDTYAITQGVAEFEYWFDDDVGSRVLVPLTGNMTEHIVIPLPAISLSNGLHRMYYRFRDKTGVWSSVQSGFFHKSGSQVNPITNLVSSCRYWFDNNIQSVKQITFQNPVNPFEVIEQIDMKRIWKGQYDFHIQFKDTVGQWSSVLSKVIEKLPYPIAEFQALQTMVCAGDTVFFTNTSMDGDTYVWNFGDGFISNDSSAVHIFSSPGLYSISLTVADTLTSSDSTLVLSDYIYVGTVASPVLAITGNDTICQGDSVQIHAQQGNLSYLWSNSETAQTITTGLPGQYSVIIYDQLMPSCFNYSDTINITVIDLPVVSLGNDIELCAGTILLNAGNPGCIYQWQDNSSAQTFLVDQTGSYSVTVTNWFGCIDTDTINVTVHDLPLVNLGPDIIQLDPPVILDAGFGFSEYNWSNGSDSQTITVALNGTYSVTVTDTNGCQNSDSVNVTFTAGLNELNTSASMFAVFPNPAANYFTIAPLNLPPDYYLITLYDLNGRTVMKEEVRIENKNELIVLPSGALADGCYRIVLTSQSVITSRNLVIRK